MTGQRIPENKEVTVAGSASLRILLVTARYLPDVGGIELHTREVATRLALMGHAVTVLTTDLEGSLLDREEIEGVRIIRVRAWPRDRDYYLAPGVYRTITRNSWDVVHLQGYHTLIAPIAMLAAWRTGIPYLVMFHSGGHSSELRNRIRGLQRRLLRPLLASAAKLGAVSPFEADLFRRTLNLPWDRFVVIRNGMHAFDLGEDVLSERDRDNPLLVSVGRLERYKGHHRVIAAMPEVLKRFPTARLRIVGQGPYEGNLHHLVQRLGISHEVEIGGIPGADRNGMARLLLRASVVALLSDYEASPQSVLEALTLGCPVLVTETSGLQEFADGGLARSIPLKSSSAEIAEALIGQIESPLAPTTVPFASWDDCARQLEGIYRSIVTCI